MSIYFIIIIGIIVFDYVLSFLIAKPSSLVIGMSETMGVFGMINANYNIDAWSNDSDHYFITTGVYPIPFIGGAGLGWKHYYNSNRVSPFSSLTGFGAYMLPVMCSGDHCKTKFGIIASASLGYDFYFIKSDRLNLHLQLGVLSQYDLANLEFFESPSNIPEIWPVINLKFGK